MLKEEFEDEAGNAGNSQISEGQAGQDTETGSTENDGGRAQQDGKCIEGQGDSRQYYRQTSPKRWRTR